MTKKRCDWCGHDDLYKTYHDQEWGVPLYDDQRLFELLMLESMQAGLNWLTILKKREALREAFSNFDAEKMVRFSPSQVEHMMHDKNIIRNRLKINAMFKNARAFLLLRERMTLCDFLWGFVDGVPKQNHWNMTHQIPTFSPESEHMSQVLKKQGFIFVGPVSCYAFMQASGMVNDHIISCFRYKELS